MPNYFFSASLSPSDGNDTFFILKETLKAVGFTVPSSSNGTTFSAGDILSSSTDFGSNAWFIVRQPQGATASYGGVQREYAFQRSTTTRTWRAKYSYSSSFTGSANATTMPTALDEVRLIGAELPGFAFDASTLPTDATYRLNICVDQEPPFSWYMCLIPNGGGNPLNILLVDGMLSGTYSPLDNDPYVHYYSDSNPASALQSSGEITSPLTASTIQTPACWTRKGESNQVYGGIALMVWSAPNPTNPDDFAGTIGTTNAYNNKDDLLPTVWYRTTTANPAGPGGYKGVASLMKIPAGPVRATGDTYSTVSSGSKDYILFRNLAFVWNGTDPVL